jgi:hypothetical protein
MVKGNNLLSIILSDFQLGVAVIAGVLHFGVQWFHHVAILIDIADIVGVAASNACTAATDTNTKYPIIFSSRISKRRVKLITKSIGNSFW